MAFSGSAGAAGNVLPGTALGTPHGVVTIDASGRALLAGDGAAVVRDSIQYLLVDLAPVGGNPLGARADDSEDGSAADTGVLVSAAPGANQHGLPTNFGAGRDRWDADSVNRLQVSIQRARGATYAGGDGAPRIILIQGAQGPNARDILIAVKSTSLAACTGLRILLVYTHSVQT